MTPGRVASFHLVRGPGPLRAAARLGSDRIRLRRVPGLRFARVLGTGRGSSTAFGADPTRTALFAVWEAPAALDAFEAGFFGTRAARIVAGGGEAYTVRLALVSGRGRWGGRDVLDGMARAVPDGPLAVLTRAVVRPTAWLRFASAATPVSGEAVREFARGEAHAAVVARTEPERWYAEELFARFVPLSSRGTWDGRDPLTSVRG